jgi:hypothetical protein
VSGTSLRAAVLLATLACGSTPAGPDPAGLNVLFIGNSLTYTNDLPGMLEALFDSSGVSDHTVESVAFPNFGLEDHWQVGDAQRAIARAGWDVVVIQQGPSATEGRPSLLEYSDRFATEAAQVGAQLALYMVWPADARSFDFDGVSESYTMAAEATGGLLFPAGEAWRAAWRSDATLALYGPDGFHPSAMGTYLAALVMFEQLTGETPVGLPGRLSIRGSGSPVVDLPPPVTLLLQEAAREANETFARSSASDLR